MLQERQRCYRTGGFTTPAAKRGQSYGPQREWYVTAPSHGDLYCSNKLPDGVLSNTIGDTKDWDSFTVLFYSPSGEPTYEPEFQEPLRMEIKRDTLGTQHRRASDTPDRDTRPLFEKYQFFTPGMSLCRLYSLPFG